MPVLTKTKGRYTVTTNPRRFDVDAIHAFLSRTGRYWSKNIPKSLIRKSIKYSLCFGLFDGARQIGFARVVTDRAQYAYLCDVYVLEEYQGSGLGKWMMKVVMSHPDLQGLRRFQLVTRNAHTLYSRFGFRRVKGAKYHMEIFRPGTYL